MFYKRIVVYIPDEKTYKALKHKEGEHCCSPQFLYGYW